MKEEPVVLICAKADQKEMVRGSSFDNKCATCGCAVMMAPSGQTFLKNNPDSIVMCVGCALKLPPPDKIMTAANSEEIKQEFKNIVENKRGVD